MSVTIVAQAQVFLRDNLISFYLPLVKNNSLKVTHELGERNLKKLAHLLFDQLGDFSLFGKALSFNILFRVDQLAVIFYIKDTSTAFDQFDI